ncbi:hypothetical protein V5O48_003544 [Marasmius crinis-equi]|uniref:AN1-type domain-containing protein n=1 Tax=Marasmius crinis-equi TaxID=585013 RepID=A0ABR3FSK1_9AGAR
MAEILKVGNQCAACPQVDFLPILCDCGQQFCKDHIAPDAHDCAAAGIQAQNNFEDKLQRCHFEACNKPSLNLSSTSSSSASCSQCGHDFCVEHRHPNNHNCSTAPPTLPKNEAARALLAKHFPTTESSQKPQASSSTTKPPKPNDTKAAQLQKLEMMKMRHKAVPVDPKDKATVPVTQRRFVKAKVEGGKEEKLYWTQKIVSTGKVFDLLATGLGIPTSRLSQYRLYKVIGGEKIPLRNDKLFADEVDDGTSVVFAVPSDSTAAANDN